MKVKKYKNIISIIMIILMMFNIIQPVLAISGSSRYNGAQYGSKMFTTDNQGSTNGVLIRRLNDLNSGEKITVFCAEYGVDFTTGTQYNGVYYNPTDPSIKRACKIAYFGWYKDFGDYTVDGGILAADMKWVKWAYVFTQQYIWETLGQSSATFVKADEQAGYVEYKNSIDNQINQMNLRPSFDGIIINIQAGETKIIDDTNGVLAGYNAIDVTQDGVRYQHVAGSNSMTISVDENITTDSIIISDSTFRAWGMLKEATEDYDTTIYFEFPSGVQNQIYSMSYNDPVSLKLELKIENYGKLELQKLNTNGDLIDGAVFNITGPNGYNEDITITNGKITIDKLKKGIYTITEKVTPHGYLKDNRVYNVEVKANETATTAIVNGEPTGTIQVIKKSEQGDLIKGTIFKVTANEDIKNAAGTITYYTSGQLVANITTDNSGVAEITNLPLGKYVVEETQATTGYLLDTTKHNVTLSYKDQTQKIITENFEKIDTTPIGEIKVVKTDNYNNGIKGAEIALFAREDIKNVAGTTIWYHKGDLVTYGYTNEDGIVTFSNLHLGKYYVQETTPPEGYVLNTNEFDTELKYKDQTTKVIYSEIGNIVDDEEKGTITIVKTDSETYSMPQGDATFEGAVYKVYANEDIYNKAGTHKFYSKGDLVATRIMNAEGITDDVTDLPLGKYIVKEEIAPEGYLLDNEEYVVNLKHHYFERGISNFIISAENVKKMGVHIFKSGIKENTGVTPGLEGVEFTIKLYSDVEKALEQGYSYEEIWEAEEDIGLRSNESREKEIIAPTYEIITTDSEGNAYTENKLPYGKYIVKETKTPEDYETSADFTFSITDDETEIKEIAKKTKHIVVNNEQLEAYIKLIKKDKNTGKQVTLSSATFEIKATEDIYDRATKRILFEKGESISQKIGSTTYTSFTTNADNIVVPDNSYNSKNDNKGEVTTPLKLPVGSYEIVEIGVPDGFLKSDESIKFEIKNIKDYDTDNNEDFIKEIVIKNEQPTGIIELEKSVALREDVDTSFVDISDLSNIEFKLYAKEDIIDKVDGSKIYEKGQEIEKYNLTKEGKLTITNLPIGIYEIAESKTLNGLVLNKTKFEVKFEQEDLTTKVYNRDLNISNDTTLIEISKTDITGDKELEGARLSVLDEEGNIIDTWISSDKSHKIEGLVVGKEYTLKEEIAPEGYLVATDISFIVEETNKIQKVTMKDKMVSMTKTDIGGNEIEGAKIQIIDKEGNIVDEWVSTKEAHKIKNLIENETYILHEEIAPEGFVKATDTTFKVTDEKEDQHIELINKIVEISKIDLTSGEELEGAELEVTDEDGNLIDKWTSTKEAHKVKGLEEGKTYILKELISPNGYDIAEEIKFVVSTKKSTQKIIMGDKTILKNIKVMKVDAETKEVITDDFVFGIYEDAEANKLIQEIKSNKEEGSVLFENLTYGIYYLKEIKAPMDYEISERIVKVEINENGIFVDDEQVEEIDNTIEFLFENTKLEVPKTGDESKIKLFAGIMILSLLGMIYIVIKNSNKNK
ncbi:MAG: hypothetical protein IJ223_07365 [Clostridia bacterium]|nr:hypothetical protein [Clostridia bacterium]